MTFAIFVMLGLPEGVLGTAWPAVQLSFDRPVSGLSSIIIAYTLGYLLATFGSGRLTELFGSDRATQVGVGITVAGLLGYVLSPGWALFVTSALLLGAGAGTVDSVINAEVAQRFGQRVMHNLHASFGIGATVGPLLVGGLLEAGASWRVAYGLLAVLEFGLLLSLYTLADQREPDDSEHGSEALTASAAHPDLALAATLIYFSIYVGVEVSVGQWTSSVLIRERGFSEGAAGLAIAGYWGGLTVGRLLLGALDDRLSEMSLLRGAGGVALAASLWFWLDLPLAVVALAVLGLAFAGIFPSLVLLTPGWLGSRRVVRAVGYQLAASSAGAIVVSAVLGRLAKNAGLDALPAAFFGLCAILAIAHLFTEWATRPAS